MEKKKENLESLLNLVKEVCDKNRQYKKGFNVITTFVKPHREVELHSRFITWLLDPKGPHGLGTMPLKLFLEQIDSKYKTYDLSSVMVRPNAFNWTEDRDIDILIYDKEQDFAIIIENKIYAKDSDKGENNGQLARYYFQVIEDVRVIDREIEKDKDKKDKKYLNHKFQDIELVFLSLDGHKPEKKIFETKDHKYISKIGEDSHRYKQITYLHHIESWLSAIILRTYNSEKYLPTVEIIQQYLDALHCVSPDVKLNQDLFAAIEKDEFLVEALKTFLQDYKDLIDLQPEKIEEALSNAVDEPLRASAIFLLKNHKHLYWHTLNDFFFNLQDMLRNEFRDNLLSRHREGSQKEPPIYQYVNDIIFEDKNASKQSPMYYRIRLENGEEWTLQPNRKKGFFLGLDKGPYAGWEKEIYLSKFKDEEGQIPILNLWNFLDGDTFNILNESKRKKIAKRYADFVKNELRGLR